MFTCFYYSVFCNSCHIPVECRNRSWNIVLTVAERELIINLSFPADAG